jgi:hypothetical protein
MAYTLGRILRTMKSSIVNRVYLSISTVLVLLVTSNLVTYWLTSDRAGPTTSGQDSSSAPIRFKSTRDGSEKELGTRHSRKLDLNLRSTGLGIEARSLFRDPQERPKVAVLSETGRLTTGVVESIDLSQQERSKVQDAFDTTFADAESDFIARAQFDKTASKPESGVYVFDVPAAQDRGESLLLSLHNRLQELLGKSRAETLCRAIDPEELRGGLGRRDMRFEIYAPHSAIGNEVTVVHYKMTDAESGNSYSTAEMTLEAFKERFGDVITFEIDEQ